MKFKEYPRHITLFETLFPIDWQHYLLGGLTIGAGVALRAWPCWVLWSMGCRRRIDGRTHFQTQTWPPQVRIVGLAASHPLSFQTQFL